MKTLSIQKTIPAPEDRKPFAQWLCDLHGIYASTPIRQQMNFVAFMRSRGIKAVKTEEWLKKLVHGEINTERAE